PCDIEWGLSQSKFYLLQARAIKSAQDADERDKVRQEELSALRAKAAPEGTVWRRYNLSESPPEPAPMQRAIVKRFMSGRGGFGLMYRDVGLDPDPALDDEGIYDLVCGRTYCNLSREPLMQFRQLPFQHNFAALKAEPRKALYPQGTPNPFYTGWKSVFVLPLMMFKLAGYSGRLKQLSTTLPDRLRKELLPAFSAETAPEAQH